LSSRNSSVFESGIGTLDSTGTVLTRTSVILSSNGNAVVNLPADTYDIYVTILVERMVYSDGTNIVAPSGVTLPISSGGTGVGTAQAAINTLAGGVVTAGHYLRGDGTNLTVSAIQAADVPTLNQNTTGNASTATTASNLVGGAAGSIAYQTGTNTTAMLLAGTGVLVGGSTPGYTTTPTLVGTNFTSIPNTALSGFGVSNGIATLDSTGKLTSAQIPASLVGAVVYQGTWNASTNTPTLASGVGTKGNYYKVSVAGSTLIDGNSQWNAGDTIIFDGTTWDKIDGIANEVLSISGTANQIVASASTGVITLSLPSTINVNTSGNAATTSQTNFSNLTIGGSQVLDAANFNSYSPTLTGTGASGTWGISISGNAATSTSATTATTAGSATTATTATNIAGGAANELVLQTATGTTGFLSAPTTTGAVATYSGSALTWAIPKTYYLTYTNASSLRSLSGLVGGEHAVVEGLGLFIFVLGSTETDDSETCFAATGGCWLLEAVAWDVAFAYWLPDFYVHDERIENVENDVTSLFAFQAGFILGSFNMSLTSLSALTATDFSVSVVGASIGDSVLVNPGNSFGASSTDEAMLTYIAFVSSTNTVTVSIRNPSANTATIVASTWNILVIK
jgi:hypothetical protein